VRWGEGKASPGGGAIWAQNLDTSKNQLNKGGERHFRKKNQHEQMPRSSRQQSAWKLQVLPEN
jgi:hypothetical protein